jgi:regulator of replication initiation timing
LADKPVDAKAAAGKPASAAGAMNLPTIPSVSGFRLMAQRIKDIEMLSAHFAELSFLEMTIDKDTLCCLNVESRDLRKDPALFSIIYFKPDKIEVLYTCLAAMSPKKRRIDVLRHFLNMLTIAEDCYKVEMKQMFQLLESAISYMTEYVTADYDKLFSQYDNLKTESSGMQKKVSEFRDANASLSKENFELKNKNDELVIRLKSLETFSDSVLALKIQEWLAEHKGEINISDFSKVYNVPETRVEQMLNKLVTEGYLETKG